ncbi:DUF2958 domain-containing protein [Vallitalea okinawensis]|uniref:DUF2958 domain-containing protein n=1 Tax=Vallitalea okinawensis TaxID=2078660 RepID=UPI000CFB51F6|nr:DUF2958 domain-containing protein [Vallitalea okinawensis]
MEEQLFSDKIAAQNNVPKLFSQDGHEPPTAYLKFFDELSYWTWYVLEAEKQGDGDYMFYGYVEGLVNELGYFSLSDLNSINEKCTRVRRDYHFKPTPLAQIIK